jgi:hypothetical protein
MNSSESVVKIASAIAKAQAEFKGVQKTGENTYDRYSYAKLDDYVIATRPVLAKYGLALLSSVDDVVALEERKTSNGKPEHAVRVKLTVRVLHESGEWVEASAWGEGQDRGDKAVYKAITGARKYGVAAALGLATTDDPEEGGGDDQANNPKQPAPRPAPSPSSQSGSDALADDKIFKSHLAKAFNSRGFTKDQMKSAVAAILPAYKVSRIEDLNPGHRHSLLRGVADGDADKFKAANQGKAA